MSIDGLLRDDTWLRRNLDSTHGGDRRAWFGPVAGFALRAPGRTAVQGTSARNTALLLAALFAGATILVVVALRGRGNEGRFGAAEEPPTVTRIEDPAHENLQIARTPRAGTRSSAVESSLDTGHATVTGRFLDSRGAAAARAEWILTSAQAHSSRSVTAPEPALHLEGALDASGELEVECAPDPEARYRLTIELPLHEPEAFSFDRVLMGDTLEVGTIVFESSGEIAGKIVDASGAVALDPAWSVSISPAASATAERPLPRPSDLWGRNRIHVEVNPADGSFLARGLDEGSYFIEVNGRGGPPPRRLRGRGCASRRDDGVRSGRRSGREQSRFHPVDL